MSDNQKDISVIPGPDSVNVSFKGADIDIYETGDVIVRSWHSFSTQDAVLKPSNTISLEFNKVSVYGVQITHNKYTGFMISTDGTVKQGSGRLQRTIKEKTCHSRYPNNGDDEFVSMLQWW